MISSSPHGRKKRAKSAPHPLNETRLRDLALHYLSRYATSRTKLARYLSRKLRERGWDGDGAANIDGLLDRLEQLNYLDDEAYAAMRGASLSRRGYGKRRIAEDLRASGIDGDTIADLVDIDGAEAEPDEDMPRWGRVGCDREVDHVAAALKLARKRKIGPFAIRDKDEKALRRDIAAMVRAGHSYSLARFIADQPVGADLQALAEEAPKD